MSTEEWRSMDEIARSTIRMQLAENVYFCMAKETLTFSLWEKLQAVYERKSSSSKLILIRQLLNMKMRETDPATSHINIFSPVLFELSSQGINFEEEVKSLALLLSLLTSWEVFCMTFTNNRPKLNLDEMIGQVLTNDIRRKSMGLTINDSAKAHHSTESTERADWSPNWLRRMDIQQWSKSRNNWSSVFCTHCRKIGHNVSNNWSIKKSRMVGD